MNNYTVLPFYTLLDGQNHNKKYAYSQIYPLLVPSNKLIPFQLLLNSFNNSALDTYSIYIYDIENNIIGGNRIKSFINSGLFLYAPNNLAQKALVYNAKSDLDFNLPYGQYYLSISDGYQTWYSDIFTVTDITDCIKIQWWDNTDFIMDDGFIAYSLNLKNTLYVNSLIGKPDYLFEEEGDSRDGLFFAEKAISDKVFKFTFVGPEYLCDAIRFTRLSDNVLIAQNGKEYKCNDITVEFDWQEQGDLAAIYIEFKTGHVAKKIAPGFNDYSIDYNSDYNV